MSAASLVLMGTGTAFPEADRASAGLALHVGGRWMPIDLGRGVLQRLCQHGAIPEHIDTLLLSHWHPDHACDLVPFLFALNYAYQPARSSSLRVVAPPGFGDFLERLYGAWRWLRPRGYALELEESEAPQLHFADVRISGLLLEHGSMPNLGFRLDGPRASIAYSGDTRPCNGLLTLARRAHILVCECTLAPGSQREDHTEPVSLGRLAAEAEVEELVLTHVGAGLSPRELERHLRTHFQGSIRFAHDRMVLPL